MGGEANRARVVLSRYCDGLKDEMTVSEGGELEIGQLGDASARVLLPPLPPQNTLTQIKQSSMIEYATRRKR